MNHLLIVQNRHDVLSRATAVVHYAERARCSMFPTDSESDMRVLRDAVETLYKAWFAYVVFMQYPEADKDVAVITERLLLNATVNMGRSFTGDTERLARQVVTVAGGAPWMRIPQSPFVRAFVTHLTAWRDSVRDELSDVHVKTAVASALSTGFPFCEGDRRYLHSDNSALARAHTAFLDARACFVRPDTEAEAFMKVMQLSDAIARHAFELKNSAKSRLRNIDVQRGDLALELAAALRVLWDSDILERSREALRFQ